MRWPLRGASRSERTACVWRSGTQGRWHRRTAAPIPNRTRSYLRSVPVRAPARARVPRVQPADPRASSGALAAKTLRRAATCACETPTRACMILHTHALRRTRRARFAAEARPQRPNWRQQPPLSTTRTQRAATCCRVHIHACPGTFPAAGCHRHRVAAIQSSGPLHGPPRRLARQSAWPARSQPRRRALGEAGVT